MLLWPRSFVGVVTVLAAGALPAAAFFFWEMRLEFRGRDPGRPCLLLPVTRTPYWWPLFVCFRRRPAPRARTSFWRITTSLPPTVPSSTLCRQGQPASTTGSTSWFGWANYPRSRSQRSEGVQPDDPRVVAWQVGVNEYLRAVGAPPAFDEVSEPVADPIAEPHGSA
jgi:hypothetical protein